MSPDAQGALGLAFGMLVALMGWIWYAATWKTDHGLRIKALEDGRNELMTTIKELTRAVNKLERHLAVSDARASQGQFDRGAGDTEPPGKW